MHSEKFLAKLLREENIITRQHVLDWKHNAPERPFASCRKPGFLFQLEKPRPGPGFLLCPSFYVRNARNFVENEPFHFFRPQQETASVLPALRAIQTRGTVIFGVPGTKHEMQATGHALGFDSGVESFVTHGQLLTRTSRNQTG